MLRKGRYLVTDAHTAEGLARSLVDYDWTQCTGFRLGRYLFLNDGGDWAIVIEKTREQIETITFGWCSQSEALSYITRILSGEYDADAFTKITNPIESKDEHAACSACA